jgi:hypothetical protein
MGEQSVEKRKPSLKAELNHPYDGDREIKRSPDLSRFQSNTDASAVHPPSSATYTLQELSVSLKARRAAFCNG